MSGKIKHMTASIIDFNQKYKEQNQPVLTKQKI